MRDFEHRLDEHGRAAMASRSRTTPTSKTYDCRGEGGALGAAPAAAIERPPLRYATL